MRWQSTRSDRIAADGSQLLDADTASRDSRGRLLAPVIVLMVLSVLSLCALLMLAAYRLNSDARETERHRAQSLLQARLTDLQRLAVDYSWWDAALEHLVVEPDADWADGNIGKYLHDTYDLASSFVVDANDRPIIGFRQGQASADNPFDVFGPELARMVEQVHAGPMAEPVPAGGLLPAGLELHFVTVSPLTPEYPSEAQLRPAPRPVLIFSAPLDQAFLEAAGNAYGLKTLTIATGPAKPDQEGLVLETPGGTRLGALTWQGDKPGNALLLQTAPALAGVLLTMTLLLALFFRRADLVLARQAALHSALRKERQLRELKSRFVTMVSHGVRTPLSTISTAVEMLERYPGRLSEEQRVRELRDIRHAAASLDQLVDDVLQLSRADSDTTNQPERRVDVALLCREIWNDLSARLRVTHRMMLTCEPPDESPSFDESHLRPILTNLFENAIKYSSGSDSVAVDIVSADRECVISVRDNGIGIPAEDLEGVFDAFRRGRNGGNVPGTGLGLTIVKAMAEKLDGNVAIESSLAAGTTVVVRLPQAQG